MCKHGEHEAGGDPALPNRFSLNLAAWHQHTQQAGDGRPPLLEGSIHLSSIAVLQLCPIKASFANRTLCVRPTKMSAIWLSRPALAPARSSATTVVHSRRLAPSIPTGSLVRLRTQPFSLRCSASSGDISDRGERFRCDRGGCRLFCCPHAAAPPPLALLLPRLPPGRPAARGAYPAPAHPSILA